MPISEAKLLERRRAMLKATRGLIAEIGLDEVTLDGLAKAAGVTPPTLYKAFGDMESMIAEAVLEDFSERLTAATASGGERGLDRLVSLTDGFAAALTGEPAYVRAIVTAFRTALNDTPIGCALLDGIINATSEAVEQIRADGDLEEWADSAALVLRIVAAQRGATTEWANGAFTEPGQLADASVYATCLMLASVARGETARRCREIAAERQTRIASEPLVLQFTA